MNAEPTIVGPLTQLAAQEPERVFARLIFAGRPTRQLTCGEFLENALKFAELLKQKNVPRRSVVILIFEHGPELLEAFVGSIIYGAIPSIFAFPSPKVPFSYFRSTLSSLLSLYSTASLLTYPALAKDLRDLLMELKIPVMTSNELPTTGLDKNEWAALTSDDIAFLQHSSGTTGLKKGVALSHRAVLAQIHHYAESLSLSTEDRIASWLPLYHDMGLIACFVLPLVTGVCTTLISPFEWVANPVMLLKIMTEERSTFCWLPNFAYNLLANNISDADLASLDLRATRAFINCSEPIHDRSHEAFVARFEKIGVTRQKLATCYAMAENTFAVTQSLIGQPAALDTIDPAEFVKAGEARPSNNSNARRQVSSGRLLKNNRLRIVDGNSRDLSERHVGEIWIQSDSMLSNYFLRPDLTEQAMDHGWYKTGDMGYIAAGELFVTGRKKDMIIVAGKNIYPQDIEELVSTVDGIVPGRVAAFGINNEELGTEDVVVVAETKLPSSNHLAIKLRIAKMVREQLECTVSNVSLVDHMWLLKSTSGKISRSANREKYLQQRSEANVV